MLDLIKAAGFRVFVRDQQRPTYCFFTDGTRIGYAQWSSMRDSVSSVHKPNRLTGTGFAIADEITVKSLNAAISCHAPHWASDSERASVVKYADWNAYVGASTFNAELVEV